jgi:peroxiredoxin family protein
VVEGDLRDARSLDPALLRELERLVDERVEARIGGLTAQIESAVARLTAHGDGQVERASILVFSGELDRVLSAFIIATAAAAMGLEVSMCFTFWGLVALKQRTVYAGKTAEERALAAMLPRSGHEARISRLNMMGAGPALLRRMMMQHNVATLPELVATARELGVRLVACKMSMGIMGIREDELIEGIEFGGAVTYVGDAACSRFSLFI